MKKIPLTRGLFAIVDDEDFEILSKSKWCAQRSSKGNQTIYAVRRDWKNNKYYLMHRVVMNTPDELVCDHINGNGLDNRKDNLRNCEHKQNLLNTAAHRDSNTGIKGLSVTTVYHVRFSINKKLVYNKKFSKLDDAIEARNKAIELHKESLLNSNDSKHSILNAKPHLDSTTGIRGISAYTYYEVRLFMNGKKVYSKKFKKLEDALKARNEATKKYHGKFAKTGE